MSRIYVGSLGTLGAIVRANFKTLPLPAAMRMAVAPLTPEVRERTLAALATLSIEPSAVLVVDGFTEHAPRARDEEARLLVLVEGSSPVIDRATRDVRSVLGQCGIAETRLLEGSAAAEALQTTIDGYIATIADRSITYRSTGVPSTVAARAAEAAAIVRTAGPRAETIADLLTGDAIVRVSARSVAAIDELLTTIDARLRSALPESTVIAGDPRLRARVDAWGRPPSTIGTLRALKTRFDPHATLAPGRYVGAI